MLTSVATVSDMPRSPVMGTMNVPPLRRESTSRGIPGGRSSPTPSCCHMGGSSFVTGREETLLKLRLLSLARTHPLADALPRRSKEEAK